MQRYLKLSAVLTGSLLLAGCIAVGGRSETTPPTLGREMIDLKAAFEQGALTEQEYREAKSRLILDGPRSSVVRK